MHNLSKILCVIDPTTDEQPALHRAAWLARNVGAELELFICYYNEYMSGGRMVDSPALRGARTEIIDGYRKRLESFAEPLRESGLSVQTEAVWDRPLYEGVVRRATTIGAEMVFKDTHHHSAVSRALLTNTDWSLIRTCPVPLWLTKPGVIAKKRVFLAAIDPMNDHDKPAALDNDILILVKALADKTGADVRAFHSFDPRIAIATATANSYIPVSLPFDEIETQIREQHEKRFNEITEFHNIDHDKAHLIAGLTHEELPQLAADINATVVVMGAVARNRWNRLFIGATAEQTLDQLPCDLLIVKPDWFKTPVGLDLEVEAA